MRSQIDFPAPLQCLWEPKRYKILWGGRGAGRSWGVARALLLMGTQRPIRVLCCREFQNSITESVHKLLGDQIAAYPELASHYQVLAARIEGKNGTSFAFEGIKNNTSKIKSYEGIDICWVEEADKVTRASWGILIPTIRKEGKDLRTGQPYMSEIWMTFNPGLATDYTYATWVLDGELKPCEPGRFPQPWNCPILESDSAFVVKMTWRDNEWFPEVLRAEMERDRKRDEDYYLNVWEGHCLQVLDGAIYAKELRRATSEGRITRVPWARGWPVSTFWDLGHGNSTCIWFAQRVAMETRVLAYYSANMEDIPFYIAELQRRGYVYDTHWLPHDAAHKKLGMKLSIEDQIRKAYPKMVRIVPKLSIEEGINAVRLVFSDLWFDEVECADGLDALRHYRYKVLDSNVPDRAKRLSLKPVHDWASDGADALRYLAIALRGHQGTGPLRQSVIDKLRGQSNPLADPLPGLGWMS